MKNILMVLLLTATLGFSCSSHPFKNIFSNKTPHEKYAEKLDDKKLDETPEGRLWLAASKTALQDAQPVSLPLGLQGFFAVDKPRALGLKFTAIRGEKVFFELSRKTTFPLYADLFKEGSETALFSADTGTHSFSLEIEETGNYVLRLQPELYKSGGYQLSVSVGPSLGFPVAGGKAKAGSFWGDDRDAGKRRHEGIDIFAPKRTPAIAAADGYITSVRNGGLGGKQVWLNPEGTNISLYYAHLDEQLVHEGQFVKKGDMVGLVGNTGNAAHTPSHLHFGIYTYGGAIDPFPFVNPSIKTAPLVKEKNLANKLKLLKPYKSPSGAVVAKANTILVPVAVDSKGYIAELPDGKLIQPTFSLVKPVNSTDKQTDQAQVKQKPSSKS
jgi:murein DD-endopeptidase MepM/ murein hydrolase activator NlpD